MSEIDTQKDHRVKVLQIQEEKNERQKARSLWCLAGFIKNMCLPCSAQSWNSESAQLPAQVGNGGSPHHSSATSTAEPQGALVSTLGS